MTEKLNLQAQIEPYWDEEELDEILHPTGNIIDSDEKIQRDRLKRAIESQEKEAEDLRSMLSAVVRWDNKEPAIALWAGHIERAEELRAGSGQYSSPESLEAGLVERFAQPVYEERDTTKGQLVAKLLPIARSSPVTQLRPEVWENSELAKARVREILDEHVEHKAWD